MTEPTTACVSCAERDADSDEAEVPCYRCGPVIVEPPIGPDNKPMTWYLDGADHLTISSDFKRPNAYLDGSREDRHRFQYQQHSIGLQFPHDLEHGPPERLAKAMVVAETIQAFHEALEWTKVDGRRLADPHPPVGGDPERGEDYQMWDWLVTELGALLDTYIERWPARGNDT